MCVNLDAQAAFAGDRGATDVEPERRGQQPVGTYGGRPTIGRIGRNTVKTIQTLVATALLSAVGLAAAADARPLPHRHCTTTFVHHHKVTRCR
jgi:hypothetical protein